MPTTATTANHSKSNYGIHFSDMFSSTYDRRKVPEIIVFFGKKFFFIRICTTRRRCFHVMTLYRRRFQTSDSMHTLRRKTAPNRVLATKSVCSVFSCSLCKRCARALKCIRIFSAFCRRQRTAESCLVFGTQNAKHWTVKWYARTACIDKMSLNGKSLKVITFCWMIRNFQFHKHQSHISLATRTATTLCESMCGMWAGGRGTKGTRLSKMKFVFVVVYALVSEGVFWRTLLDRAVRTAHRRHYSDIWTVNDHFVVFSELGRLLQRNGSI